MKHIQQKDVMSESEFCALKMDNFDESGGSAIFSFSGR